MQYDDLHKKMSKLEDQLSQLALRRKTLMTENRNKKDEMLIYKEYHSLIHELVKVLWSFKEIVIAVYICFHCFSHIVHHHF